jgi:selenoprotein W-related protein
MAEKIFEEFGQKHEVLLIPSSGGVFEVTVGDKLVYSKKATGRHAEYEADVAPGLR